MKKSKSKHYLGSFVFLFSMFSSLVFIFNVKLFMNNIIVMLSYISICIVLTILLRNSKRKRTDRKTSIQVFKPILFYFLLTLAILLFPSYIVENKWAILGFSGIIFLIILTKNLINKTKSN